VREETVQALPGLQRVWRREDLLLVYLQYVNLELRTDKGAPMVVPKSPELPSYLIVNFQGQHVLEQSLASTDILPGGRTGQPSLPSALLAGASRLVFGFVGKSFQVPFTFESLFDWLSVALRPSLSSYADQPPPAGPYPGPPTSPPGQEQTAIEAPWQLIVTPDSAGGWVHSLSPVTHNGWTELWHARLGAVSTNRGTKSVVEPPATRPNLRAIWSPGYQNNFVQLPDPFLPTTLTIQDRFNLVDNMTTYTKGVANGPAGYIGVPARANLFHLSALGASMEVIGDWPAAAGTTGLVSWLNRTALGRDSYVRVEQAGYMFPTGHKASLVTVTERQFLSNTANGEVEAFLVNDSFVVVRDPLMDYDADPFDQSAVQRGLPFRRITLTTLATPAVNTTSGPPLAGLTYLPGEAADAFWVTDAASGQDILFHAMAEDWAGHVVDFDMPLAYISNAAGSAFDPHDVRPTIGNVARIIAGFAGDPRATVDLGGQSLTFVAPGTGNANTKHITHTFVFSAVLPAASVTEQALTAADQPAWYPQWGTADVEVSGLSQLAGTGSLATIAPNLDYLAGGYSAANVAEIFADIENALSVVFGSASAGGVATPNFIPTALSRQLGPLADAANMIAGKFDPLSYFADGAMLLGGISLGQIIKQAVGDELLSLAPSIDVAEMDDPKTDLPQALTISYTLKPNVQSDQDGGGTGLFNPHADASLVISASLTVPVADPSQATYSVTGTLSEFDIDLFGPDESDQFLVVNMEKVSFVAQTGAQPTVGVSIRSVDFGQALSFVDILEQFLSSVGGDGGPAIDVEPSGITVNYSLPVPDASLGAISISNMSLHAELDLPFNGGPVTATFVFCTQESPFQLSIGMFGGGGSFAVVLAINGVQSLQAALEVGLVGSLDLGVASGSASLEAGIYFSLAVDDKAKQSIKLTGFLRASGKLTFLGIVAISVDFHLGLTYLDPGKAYGEASVTVNISVLFFSKSVTANCRKTIGGGGDPSFEDLMDQTDWANYVKAFAD
jgi:hypothetical protein